MIFILTLECQRCGVLHEMSKEYNQDFVPMSMRTHQCYHHLPEDLGVMLPMKIVIKDEPPE